MSIIQLAGLVLLLIGALLEVGGVAFWGLDAMVGLCFVAAAAAGGVGAIAGRQAAWGLTLAALGALSFCLHVWLNLS